MSIGITEEQYKMIDLLLEGKPIASIARILNKSRTSIYNWLSTEVINQEIENRKSQMRIVAKDKITSNIGSCVQNMIDLANNSKDPRVKLQANKYLIDQVLGVPGTSKDNTFVNGENNSNNENKLRAELEDIKNLKVIK